MSGLAPDQLRFADWPPTICGRSRSSRATGEGDERIDTDR